jgi:hypothetical protein
MFIGTQPQKKKSKGASKKPSMEDDMDEFTIAENQR